MGGLAAAVHGLTFAMPKNFIAAGSPAARARVGEPGVAPLNDMFNGIYANSGRAVMVSKNYRKPCCCKAAPSRPLRWQSASARNKLDVAQCHLRAKFLSSMPRLSNRGKFQPPVGK